MKVSRKRLKLLLKCQRGKSFLSFTVTTKLFIKPSIKTAEWVGDWSITDDIRMATSLASEMLIRYLTTCISCVVLAFLIPNPCHLIRSPRPHDRLSPFIRRTWTNRLSIINRAISAIATIKALNATTNDNSRATLSFNNLESTDISPGALLPVWHDRHVRPGFLAWRKFG